MLTALCWSWTAVFFTLAGKRIGLNNVNLLRLSGAVLLLFSAARFILSGPVASWYEGGNIIFIVLSGVIGLAVGDNALFAAMIRFGPRRATLIMACVPIITSFLAFLILGERLAFIAWVGIIITVTGVGWVVLERSANDTSTGSERREEIRKGILLGLLAAFCQAVGLILAKSGMGDTVTPIAATLLRMVSGWIGIALLVTVKREWKNLIGAFDDGKAIALTGAGTIVGPFLGVWLSLVSVRYTETGVAATLMGLTPLIVIPWAHLIFKEKISARVWIGTCVAVVGTALIFKR